MKLGRRKKLLQGNEACAEGAMAAGVRFYAGYPITPSTEIAEIMAAKLPRLGGVFIQMEDEIASMAAVIGASLAGTKSLTATSGPGFSLKQENFGYAIMAEIPCVLVNVQRGGPSTGLPTSPSQGDVMQARWGTHGSHDIIALSPSSVRETYDLTIQAVNFSEKYRTPVILLLDEVIGHMREAIEVPMSGEIEIIERKKPTVSPEEYSPYKAEENGVAPLASFGDGYHFHVTGLSHDEKGFPSNSPQVMEKLIKRLSDKIQKNTDDIIIIDSYQLEDAEYVIFCYGSVARPAKMAVKEARKAGKKVGMIRAVTIWPFPGEVLKELVQNASYILVPEMNEGQILEEVERFAGCILEIDGLSKTSGELITPYEILSKIQEVF